MLGGGDGGGCCWVNADNKIDFMNIFLKGFLISCLVRALLWPDRKAELWFGVEAIVFKACGGLSRRLDEGRQQWFPLGLFRFCQCPDRG